METLKQIKDLRFEREMNLTDEAWLSPSFKLLGSRVLFYYAARTLSSALDSNVEINNLNEVLSNREMYNLKRKLNEFRDPMNAVEESKLLPGLPASYSKQIDKIGGYEFIVATKGTLGGKPRVKDTRISVEVIATNFAMGSSVEEILEHYPSLTRVMIDEALRFWIRRSA